MRVRGVNGSTVDQKTWDEEKEQWRNSTELTLCTFVDLNELMIICNLIITFML